MIVKEEKVKTSLSWKVIVPLLIFLPPLGWLLMVKRMKWENQRKFTTDSSATKVGVGLLIFGGLVIFSALGGEGEGGIFSSLIIPTLFLLLPGLYLYKSGHELATRNQLYKKYLDLVSNVGINSISEIANSVHQNTSKVKADLKELMSIGVLQNYYIDEVNMLIIDKNAIAEYAGNPSGGVIRIEMKCKSCGASNKVIKGVATACQYCNSML